MIDSALNPKEGESLFHRFKLIVAISLPLVIVIIFCVRFLWIKHQSWNLTIATGSKGGTYFPLGNGIAKMIDSECSNINMDAIETLGNGDNFQKITQGEVEMAFLQNNTTNHPSIRSVANLYSEVLHIMVQLDEDIQSIDQLRNRRINLGPKGSGASQLMIRLLQLHGLSYSDYIPFHLPTLKAVQYFDNKKIDAAVFLSGIKMPAVEQILNTDKGKILSIGDPYLPGSSLEGLCHNLPGVNPDVIPARTYGRYPERAIGTVSVDAILVVNKNTPSYVVQRVAETLFSNRVSLTQIHQAAAELTEKFDHELLGFPIHKGALDYYHRNKPPFLVAYAEVLSLGLALAVAIISGFVAIREWGRRNKKNRIDIYYLKIEEVAEGLSPDHSKSDLMDGRRQLMILRKNAFTDLVAERLDANESFSIFLDSIAHHLSLINEAINQRTVPNSAEALSGRLHT